MIGTTSCKDVCVACDDVVDRVHLPLGHVEIIPFEFIAESLTLDAHVPFHSIIHVPEHCCLLSESAERRSIVTYEVFPLAVSLFRLSRD